MAKASKQDYEALDERRHFIHNSPGPPQYAQVVPAGSARSHSANGATAQRKAKLARQETLDEYEQQRARPCVGAFVNMVKQKPIVIVLIIVLACVAAIYCVPYVQIEPRVRRPLPSIPFNFRDGPLRASSASQFKIERLFDGQVQGPESVALDSQGNMYMAIQGGFVLYAHLNTSSPPKQAYYEPQQQQQPLSSINYYEAIKPANVLPDLVKIAELNGIKQMPYESKRRTRDGHAEGGPWRRECQLDEKVYGVPLYTGGLSSAQLQQQQMAATGPNAIDSDTANTDNKFRPNVIISRCSRPLGVRLSPDESYLYVVDSLSGLYRVSLKVAERPYSTQRLVTKLVDFRTQRRQLLPVLRTDASSPSQTTPGEQQVLAADYNSNSPPVARARAYLNISLLAVDDLVIDYGAGSRGGDLIYMTDASQSWPAFAFVFDMLEARPTGVVLRYDTGANSLAVLDPSQVAQVRTSATDLVNVSSRLYTTVNTSADEPYMGIGAPRLDENDVFDDRPLHFPNGLELTDDRQALLIADTTNKRIIKHYVRGPRTGTSDLWAWTPNYPDNIRRGHDPAHETYWVVGCGEDNNEKVDYIALLDTWPRLRKYILKNIYLLGWIIEMFGTHLLRSTSVRDFGYSIKIGHILSENACPGMMILQYNSHGDILRSIHSEEFPNDLAYYSQVTELIDAKTQEHALYLGSPSYKFVTKMILPTDTHPVNDAAPFNDVR